MKFFYLRDKKQRPIACVASQKSPDGDSIYFQFATWHPRDTYDKQLGRMIAAGRLESKPYGLDNSNHVKRELVHIISMLYTTPTRTRKAAKLWLKNHPTEGAP